MHLADRRGTEIVHLTHHAPDARQPLLKKVTVAAASTTLQPLGANLHQVSARYDGAAQSGAPRRPPRSPPA
ncbi:hypothetical protein GCM10010412_099830 [Nonomuraea recticatena]|uniref:Uncharacterized protein n=1 Tax=Nonomuraea recticatena TaxID=46178 RepID=A0ABN3TGD3_9ACTN